MKNLFESLKKPTIVNGQIWLFFFGISFVLFLFLANAEWFNYEIIAQGGYTNWQFNEKLVYLSGIQWFMLLSILLATGCLVLVNIIYILIMIIVHIFEDFYKPKFVHHKGERYTVLSKNIRRGVFKTTILTKYDKKLLRPNSELEVVVVDVIGELTLFGKIVIVVLMFIWLICLSIALILAFPFLVVLDARIDFKKISEEWLFVNKFEDYHSTLSDNSSFNFPSFLTEDEVKKFFSRKTQRKLYRKFNMNDNVKYYPDTVRIFWFLDSIGKLDGIWKDCYHEIVTASENRRKESEL